MIEIPNIGFGTWSLYGNVATSAVYEALSCGYRLIDTARLYENECAVGRGIKHALAAGIVAREDVFVTTKILPTSTSVRADLEDSLKKLKLDYVDCLMLHWHGERDDVIYSDIVAAVRDGLVRTAGISGFYSEKEIRHFVQDFGQAPSIVQNENHLYYQNRAIDQYLQREGIALQCFYPFGGQEHVRQTLEMAEIKRIADNHHKSAAQVILRWHLQHGFIPLPGSSNPSHIRQNFEVFDFSLTQEEMLSLNALDTGRRYSEW